MLRTTCIISSYAISCMNAQDDRLCVLAVFWHFDHTPCLLGDAVDVAALGPHELTNQANLSWQEHCSSACF